MFEFLDRQAWCFVRNSFFFIAHPKLIRNAPEIPMKAEEFKALTNSLKALSKDHAALADSLNGATSDASGTKKLWKRGSKPFLINAGLAM